MAKGKAKKAPFERRMERINFRTGSTHREMLDHAKKTLDRMVDFLEKPRGKSVQQEHAEILNMTRKMGPFAFSIPGIKEFNISTAVVDGLNLFKMRQLQPLKNVRENVETIDRLYRKKIDAYKTPMLES
ncbi:MAG: hypothetical protein JRL30_30130, partial [Deltaproteobacteria bacterium]|nr:hypothetical protein [Deltaproteobacteria bacterium]